jgi:predicted amidohydrolase YtcJ
MRKLIYAAVLCMPLLFLAGKPRDTADLIVYNAVIHTMDDANPQAQAIAVRNGIIVKVGSNEEVRRLAGKLTRQLDAGGKAVIPGIFDSHLHVIRGGRFYNLELRWDGVRSLKTALGMLREQALRTPPGQWVRVVGGWNAWQFEEKRLPTLAEINEATGNVPAFILHLYGHAYLNKAGLEALQINGETANPAGGLIEKDSKGNPTGLLIAEPNAFLLYSTLAKLPVLNEEQEINSTKGFMQELNRFGITAVMDAGGGFQNFPDDYRISEKLCREDALTVRLPYYLFAQKGGKEVADYTQWINSVEIGQGCDEHNHATEYYVQGGGENLVMSAADFENFDQPRPELSPAMEAQLYDVVSLLVKNRWPFRIHATYNESITRFLNVIEKVNSETPLNGLVWFFDHAETVSEENLKRIKQLNGGVAIQYRMAFQGESFIRRYGRKAAENTPPVKKMIEMGIPIGMGSDGTRVSSYNPFIGLYWLTTGKTIGGTMHMAPRNLLDRKTALYLYTSGSAKLINLHKDRGMLREGYLADFALLSADYFTVPDEDILKIESLLTVLNGKVVYGSGTFSTFAPPAPKAIPEWSPVNFFGGYQNAK